MTDIPIDDPFGVVGDPEMPLLALALDPTEVQRRFGNGLPRLAHEHGVTRLRAIRVVRYKPKWRCVVEYDLDVEGMGAPPQTVTLLGKVWAGRSEAKAYRILDELWRAGFGPDSRDGISVPQPIAVVPEFGIWLQRKVPGRTATTLLPSPEGAKLVRRIAEAAHKLHCAAVAAERRHTMADELRKLRERLPLVAISHMGWAGRIDRLLDASERLGQATPEPQLRGIHRDFYADQVIVDGSRLYLIDFDLYREGDPGLDIGNFLGHITEQSLRTLGDAAALAHLEQAMEERFVELSGESVRAAVRAYALLTLVRHVYLSTLFSERRPFTERLLELCEERLHGKQ